MLGEKSCACIVLRAPDADARPAMLRKYLRELGVADFKLPDRFQILERLPLTAVGKTDKVLLRAHFQPQTITSQP